MRDLLGIDPRVRDESYNLSGKPVDNMSSDKYFLEYDIAEGIIFKGRQSRLIHIFSLVVEPGYNYLKKFRGGVRWYMMESIEFFSKISFYIENENGKLVSFKGQSITFRLSIEDKIVIGEK